MEEKLWKRIGAEQDAYWTLSNGTELAMGGLSVSIRDYARFARLYLNGGSFHGEQILTKEWVRDSMDVSAAYSRPGANQDVYNAIGYGYQWWVPEGDRGEFMAIGSLRPVDVCRSLQADHHSKDQCGSGFHVQGLRAEACGIFPGEGALAGGLL